MGTVQIGNLMSDAERYEYIRSFGFGSTTGIELAGESAGILYDWDREEQEVWMRENLTIAKGLSVNEQSAFLEQARKIIALPMQVPRVQHRFDGHETLPAPCGGRRARERPSLPRLGGR